MVSMSPRKPTDKQNMNSLYKQVASKVLSESLRIGKGETVTVETWNNGVDFARQFLIEARRIGSIPLMVLEDEEAYVQSVPVTPDDIRGSMGKHEYSLLSATDAYVFIPGPPAGGFTKKLTGKNYTESVRYNSSWYETAGKAKLRGVRLTFGYVGSYLSDMLDKSVKDIVDVQLRASLVDFKKIKSRASKLAGYLQDGAEARLTSGKTKLTFHLKGEVEVQDGVTDKADVSAGNNMSYVPPGFVTKELDSSTASGAATISPSVTRLGMIHDAVFNIDRGRIKKSVSRSSAPTLEAVQDIVQKTGGKVSYLTVGLNPLMRYGYAQDRFVEGALCLNLGFNAIIRDGDLTIDGKQIVEKGKLTL
jgi:leucyl aminopeptidase (aminopeptidase T)